MSSKLLVALLVALAVATGGLYAASRFFAAPDDRALARVPANAAIYASVFIEPSRPQRSNINSILEKLPELDSVEEAKDELITLLEPELAEIGLDYEADVEPWLGDQIALFLLPPGDGDTEPEEGALLISAEDVDAAEDAVDKVVENEGAADEVTEQTYEGVEYRLHDAEDEADDETAFGFLGEFLVIGSEQGFTAAIDASAEGSLDETDKFTTAIDPLSDDQVALFYLDNELVNDLVSAEGAPGIDPEIFGTFGGDGATAVALHAGEEAVVFEASSTLPDEGPFAELYSRYDESSDVLGSLPGDAWLAFSFPDLGGYIEGLMDTFADAIPAADLEQAEARFTEATGLDLRADVLSWMADAGFFVQGTNLQELGGGLVIESDDPEKTNTAVSELQEAVTGFGGRATPLQRSGLEGFSLQPPGMPAPVNVLGGERFVAAYGDAATDALVDPESTLQDDEAYNDALEAMGGEYSPAFYLDGPGLVRVIDAGMAFAGETDPTYQQEVKPYLDHLSFVVAGVDVDEEVVVQRVVIGAR